MSWSTSSLLQSRRLRKNLSNSFQRSDFRLSSGCWAHFKTPARRLLRSCGFLTSARDCGTFARDCGTFARDCGRSAWDLENRTAFTIAASRMTRGYEGVQSGGRRLEING